MKSAEQIFEKFKQIFLGNGNSLNTASVHESPGGEKDTPLSADKRRGKARIKNANQPGNKPNQQQQQQRRKYPPPMKPLRFSKGSSNITNSRAPAQRVVAPRLDYSEVLYSDDDSSSDSETSEIDSSSDDAAGQQFSYDDQCVPEI